MLGGVGVDLGSLRLDDRERTPICGKQDVIGPARFLGFGDGRACRSILERLGPGDRYFGAHLRFVRWVPTRLTEQRIDQDSRIRF